MNKPDDLVPNTADLVRLGLTEGEGKVYLALLKLGTCTVGPIINEAEVSTSKIYVILDKLITKGMASMAVNEGTKMFCATHPTALLDFLKREEVKAKENLSLAHDLINNLSNLSNTSSPKPPMEILKGKHGFRNAIMEMIQEAPQGDEMVGLIGERVSFAMQSLWQELSLFTEQKKISQVSLYEHSTWYKKDPNIHKREERKLLFPKVLSADHQKFPYMLVLGNYTIIADFDGDEVITFVHRNKMMADGFRKLLHALREQGEFPEGYGKKKNE